MEEKRKKNLNQSPIALINKIAFDKMEWKQEIWWNYRTSKKTDRSILATRLKAILKKKKKKETSSCRVTKRQICDSSIWIPDGSQFKMDDRR